MVTGNEQYKCFVKEHFRPLKIKDGGDVRIGRRTYDWILLQENRTRLGHLTMDDVQALAGKWALKMVPFDDGYTYIVNPDHEREVMVAFYEKKAEQDGAAEVLPANLDVSEKELLESYSISQPAIELLTGDAAEDIDLDADAPVDFLTNEMLEQALAEGTVRIFVEEGSFTVISADEETPEGEIYTLHMQRPLPGTEVPISKLDLKRRTYITGAYRDQVENSSHDFEHHVTRMEDL